MDRFFKMLPSPVGVLKLVASHEGLAGVLWSGDRPGRTRHLDGAIEDDSHPILNRAAQQLQEYFNGERTEFTLPLDMAGTPFQQLVWNGLLTIPFGESRSYGELARQIGMPKHARAVGAATGRNPLSIIVPCHRVIGANGTLTGFAGGMENKAFLLELESARRAMQVRAA